jgi:hypothetical protein
LRPFFRPHPPSHSNLTGKRSVQFRLPGTTRSRARFFSEEIYFAVSKIHRFTVLYRGFECERPEVFCKHGKRKANAFGIRV